MPAIEILSQQTSQDQQTGAVQSVKFISCFIQYNETVFAFHGVAADADFNNYIPVFRSTMANFNKLTDPAKLNVKPKRIKIYAIKNPQTLADVFKNQKVAPDKMKELALLNNLELTDNVEKGRLIKLIGE
jgi:predicted Zn-dependent protease